jgi:hypothetical protein
MVTRRAVLGGAAAGAAALATPLVSSALNSSAVAAAALSLKVSNHTGQYWSQDIRMYLVGTDLVTGRQGFVKRRGVFTPCQLSHNGPDGYADLAVPLATSGDTSFAIPDNMSGRIYFAIGKRLRFKVVVDGAGRPALQYPAGWVPVDPNYGVLHDFVEFTYEDGRMYCNTTAVDMFSIPLAIHLDGARSQITGTLKKGHRDQIFAAIRSLPAYSRLVVGNNLRVIAPGHGINTGLFAANYFDPYITEAWNKLAARPVRITVNSGVYTGRVSGGVLNFDRGGGSIRKPSTQDVFFCNGALAAPNTPVGGPIAARVGAALNRSTLRDHDKEPVTDAGLYYRTGVSNHYARILHEHMVDGRAYGFPFDDVAEKASYIEDPAPRQIWIRLTPFGTKIPT